VEQWKPISGFDGYEISDQGRVCNSRTNRELGVYDNGHGISQVVMRRNNVNVARAVHKLVAMAFLEPPQEGQVAIHIDGDTTNNHIHNLRWADLWFASARTRQLKRHIPRDDRRVIMHSTGIIYDNALVCAKAIESFEDLIRIAASPFCSDTVHGSTFDFV
jgi:hypothetical protein